jgi:hypothetical protein
LGINQDWEEPNGTWRLEKQVLFSLAGSADNIPLLLPNLLALAIELLGIGCLSPRNENTIHTKMYTWIFITILFVIA